MQFQGVMRILLPTLWAISTFADEKAKSTTGVTAAGITKHVTISSASNTTSKNNHSSIFNSFDVDSSMIQRALYVLIGVTTIGVFYFLVRAVRWVEQADVDDLLVAIVESFFFLHLSFQCPCVWPFLINDMFRQKKRTTSKKKYGLLSNYDDSVEMAVLESDEEDDTVYEARSLRRWVRSYDK